MPPDPFENIMKSLGNSIINEITGAFASALMRSLQIKKGMEAAFDFGFSFLGGLFANGAAFHSGVPVTAYANGGVVNSPTLFPMANGAGLMGEAGPEAVMPLTRIGGKLGVEAKGGGDNYNISINAVDAASFQEMMYRNPEATVNIVRDLKDRGQI